MGERPPEKGWKTWWEAVKCELGDTSPRGSFWLTKLIVVVNVIAFLVFAASMLNYKLAAMPTITCIVELECPLRLVGSMFLHAGIVHLAGNMFYLYIVGDNVEVTLGRPRFLAIYLASGLAGALAHSAIALALFAHPPPFIVGASGAISGLVGAYLVLYPGSRMCKCIGYYTIYYCFPMHASTLLTLWIALQLVLPLIEPYVAAFAHLAGLFTGAGLTYLLAEREDIDRLRAQFLRGQYRGLPVDHEVLSKPSVTPLTLAAVVVAGVILGGLAGQAAGQLWECSGAHYSVKAKLVVREYRGTPPPGMPYKTLYEIIAVEKAWIEACRRGGEASLGWITRRTTETLEEGTLDKAPYTAAAVAAALTALVILSIKALRSPEELEVTYIPPGFEPPPPGRLGR